MDEGRATARTIFPKYVANKLLNTDVPQSLAKCLEMISPTYAYYIYIYTHAGVIWVG